MSHYRSLYRLVQAVACMGGLALPGVASAANFTFTDGGAFPRARFGGTKRGYPVFYLASA